MRRPGLVLLAVLAIALVASACTSGSDSVATPAGEPATEQPDTEQPDTEQPDTTTTDRDTTIPDAVNADAGAAGSIERTDSGPVRSELFISPIFEAIGVNFGDLQSDRVQYARDAEELVRECMADAGFEYVPVVVSVPRSTQREWELNRLISHSQFSEQFGFGISTLLALDFAEDGVQVFVEDTYGPPLAAPRSEAVQQEYDLALNGRIDAGGDLEEVQQQGGSPFGPEGSCRRFGYETVWGLSGDKFDQLSNALGEEYDELAAQIRADERTRAADREWQQCMAELGYSFEARDEAPSEIAGEAVVLLSRNRDWIRANIAIREESTGVALASLNAADRQTLLEQIGVFDGLDVMVGLRAELDTLIAKELAMASDDHGCLSIDVYADVQRAYEEQFVQDHSAQLELIAAGEDAE